MNRLTRYVMGVLVLIGVGRLTHAEDAPRPNFVVILCDNLGYGDVGCFGSKKHSTPRIDRMAREGIKLTSFYSTSGVCTPSRASLADGLLSSTCRPSPDPARRDCAEARLTERAEP